MSDENQSEGKTEGGGEQNANSASLPNQSQLSSGDLVSAIATLQKKLDAQDGEIRALKGGKDKAVDRVEKSNTELLAKLGKYLNVDEKTIQDAQRQSVLDDLIAERLNGQQPEPIPQGSGIGQGAKTGSIDVLNQYGLNANDPDVAEAIQGKGGLELELAVSKVALKRATKPVADASAATSVVGRPTPPVGVEENTKKYVEEIKAASGKGSQFGNAIKDKYRNLGVPVDEITFKIS